MKPPGAPMSWSTGARADPAASAVLAAYRVAGFLVRPLLPLALARRAARGKEERGRLGERFGRASLPRPPGPLVWVHAASVGETNAVMPLIARILAAGPSVVFTCVTMRAAEIAAARLPAGAIHQFSPLDIAPLVGRFLAHWRPDCALFVESELWPATIMKLAALGIPQILVNARLSPRSFAGWHRFPRIARALFSRIGLCLAQSEKDGERYRALGVPAVTVTGNLKFDAPAPAADPAAVAAFRAVIGNRPTWVAASTHAGEEEAVAAAHRLLRADRPDVLTIIVPRHPERGPEICAMLAAAGLSVAQRSAGEAIGPRTDIYLADTMNELGLFYRAAPIAFLGGSLISHGGQNPIEPARLDTVILHGPDVHNFEEIYAALDACTGARPVSDAADLAATLASLFDDRDSIRRAATAAAKALAPFSGAVERTMQALAPFLAEGGALRRSAGA